MHVHTMHLTAVALCAATIGAASLGLAERTTTPSPGTPPPLLPDTPLRRPSGMTATDLRASDRIVVRFNQAATRSIEERGRRGRWGTGLDSLDAIGFLMNVTEIKPQFRGATREKARSSGTPDLSGFHVVRFDRRLATPEEMCAFYRSNPMVASAETIGLHPIHADVNDSYYAYQWHLDQPSDSDIDMPEAWERESGSPQVTVAVLDTGVRYYHDDLGGLGASNLLDARGNLWRNAAEDAGLPGVDDDGNGYVDDHLGWDFVSSPIFDCWNGEDCTQADNDPRDFNGHGTHCAGIVGALNNNGFMVASVAGGRGTGALGAEGDGVRLMSLKIGHSAAYGGREYGFVDMSFAAQALYYAANNGARIASCSWGSSNSGGLGAAIDYFVASGGLVFKASGNSNSESADYMGSRADVINVAATDQSDRRADFSNFGSWIDISAPGVDILSTYHDHADPGTDYAAFLSGTSMATPLAAGAAALVWSVDPSMPASRVWDVLRGTADEIDSRNGSFAGKLGAGRINVASALAALGVPEDPSGACCVDEACQLLAADDCLAAGGSYFGDGSDCSQVDCTPPDPTGGCCLGTSCATLTQVECGTRGGDWLGEGSSCDPDACAAPPSSNLMLVSFRGNTSIPGVGTARNDDIVSFDPDTGDWSMYFDGSDVGFTGGAIDAFCLMQDGSILLSKSTAGSVGGLAYDDSDVVRFVPDSLGWGTSGGFELYLDASDLQMTQNGEDIDGLSILPDGRLVISTAGTTRIPGLPTIRDEDLVLFTPATLGADTSGTIELFLDNSDVGLNNSGGEDVDAVHVDPSGVIRFSCVGDFSVAGLTGADEDLVEFAPGSTGSQTSGTFASFRTGSELGLPSGADIGGYCELER